MGFKLAKLKYTSGTKRLSPALVAQSERMEGRAVGSRHSMQLLCSSSALEYLWVPCSLHLGDVRQILYRLLKTQVSYISMTA